MKVLHLSWLKRSDGELGGVEKFAHYLQRALTEGGHECQIISWRDYPNAANLARVPNPDKALMLGSWAESQAGFDIVVADGYWGAGISATPVVPVIHGTWAQFHINMGSSPWTNIEVKAQHEAYNAANAFPVAVSAGSARELLAHHRVTAQEVIMHGIDLEEFRPQKHGNPEDQRPVILHAATNAKKGKTIIPAIERDLGADFRVLYLNAGAGEEAEAFQRGDVFLHPSKHEGNAYALLEAMATGLPIVTTNVGLFESIDDGLMGRTLTIQAPVAEWASACRDAWGDGKTPYRAYAREARAWAKRIADFETFKGKWIAFLEAKA